LQVLSEEVRHVLAFYPKIFFACHVRHVRDPETRRELSAHQASILDHLDDKEPTNLMNLAKHMGVTNSTMCLNVDRLVRGGYVRRDRDPKDARRICLRLTPAGVRIKEMDKVLDPARVASMLSRLDSEQRRAGLLGLELLARAAEEEVASRSTASKSRKRKEQRR
jgi:MarR family transcriptional regulator, organic hydroperoxide resistance regulator